MDQLDYNLYIIAEVNYKKKNEGKNNIFPEDWYSSQNYKLKTEIIAEALKKDILIQNTELYQSQFLERVDN